MIGYLEGKLLKAQEDRILLLVDHVGYEVLLPAFVMATVRGRRLGEEVALYVFHQQTERQPKPLLIGFNLEGEKEFFQHFITVEDIGPQKAVKAMTLPVHEIARAIEAGDIAKLKTLKGIGLRTAQKMVATLKGKMVKFAMIRETEAAEPPAAGDFAAQVQEVLVRQLGHKPSDARRMIEEALKRKGSVSSPEELIEEVYRAWRSPAASR